MGVFEFHDGRLMLTEINPDCTMAEVRSATEADFVVSDVLVPMRV